MKNRRHARAVGWMVKMLLLELCQSHVCDPGDVGTRVIMELNRPFSANSSGLLFLMDLRRLRSVSQYSLELMVLLFSRNSTSSVKLDGSPYKNPRFLLNMRVPGDASIHTGDFIHIPRCLATFCHSGIAKYVNG
ncbi:hypothetical protein TNCV_4618001 [Trichonephila clavipes]|nr:hypothetical protein TNCV_4618001 [Trichonephila clavipes]